MHGKIAPLDVIEQAKVALMVTYGLTADEAFELLRFHSQTRNVKLRAIAAQLTSLLSTRPTRTLGITQFDRLIDDVTRSVQTPTGQAVEPVSQGPPGRHGVAVVADRRRPRPPGRAAGGTDHTSRDHPRQQHPPEHPLV